MNVRVVVLLGLVGLLAGGCSHVSMRSESVRFRLPSEIVKEYAYPKGEDFDCRITLLEASSHYVVKRVELKALAEGTNAERRITLDYYDLRQKEKTPVVLVLPMAGGGYTLERHFAAYFANHGYASAIVHREKIPRDTKVDRLIEDFNSMLRRMVLDHRRVIDWIETQPDLDAGRLGIFGISLGGIKGAVLTPIEGRIRAAVLGLTAGDLPHLLIHSTEAGLTKRREVYLKENNLTPAQGEEKLRKMITRDPLNYARYVDPSKIMLVLARFDTVVPFEKGLLLKEKMGNPETIVLPSGHYTAALGIPYIKSQSFDFFAQRFADHGRAADRSPRVARTRGR